MKRKDKGKGRGRVAGKKAGAEVNNGKTGDPTDNRRE
jgi:hypothetical protein